MLKKDIGEILSVRNITKKDAAWYCLVSIIFTAVLWLSLIHILTLPTT